MAVLIIFVFILSFHIDKHLNTSDLFQHLWRGMSEMMAAVLRLKLILDCIAEVLPEVLPEAFVQVPAYYTLALH